MDLLTGTTVVDLSDGASDVEAYKIALDYLYPNLADIGSSTLWLLDVPKRDAGNWRFRVLYTNHGTLIGYVVVSVNDGLCHTEGFVPPHKKPNKAPEPTPLPVMPPAEPGVTPGSGVAHL